MNPILTAQDVYCRLRYRSLWRAAMTTTYVPNGQLKGAER